MIELELMGVAILFKLKSILEAVLIAGGKVEKDDRGKALPWVLGEVEEQFQGVMSKPRKAHFQAGRKRAHRL